MSMRSVLSSTTFISGMVGAAFLTPTWCAAADFSAPVPTPTAVGGVQAQLSAFGGVLSRFGLYGANGSLALPLGPQFEFKVDGTVGSWDQDVFGIGAVHLFWRDPSRAMVGLYASYTAWDRFGGVHAFHVGGEGALYFGRWSFEARAGVETGNSTSAIIGPFLETYQVKTRFFDMVDVAYYLQDNLKLSVGHRYIGGRNAAAFGGEFGFNLGGGTMASLFVEARVGEADYHGVWGGLRFYFDRHEKSLMQRHRANDAPSKSLDQLKAFRHTKTAISAAPPPPPPPPPPDGYGT
jgi:hypothetical protein